MFCFHSKLWNREFSVESQITFPGVIDCLYIPPELLDSQEVVCFIGVHSTAEQGRSYHLFGFDMNTGDASCIVELKSRVVAISYYPEGSMLIVSCEDKSLHFFQNQENGFQLVKTYQCQFVASIILIWKN